MNLIESFSSIPLQAVIPSYLYQQYSDDSDLQAFVSSQNDLAQSYLDWFNTTPLAVYTQHTITGPLLDWTAQGIYGITRPVLATNTSQLLAGYDSAPYDTISYNASVYLSSGTATPTTDDIYKRVMTWNLYRGDGQTFSIGWLKNRISRFLNGANGTDFSVLNDPASVSVANGVFTVTYFASDIFTQLQLCYANEALAFPFQYSMTFVAIAFLNDGGVLQMTTPLDYPSSPAGLVAGSIWYNGGVISVISGVTPNPMAPPIYFSDIDPPTLLALGGGNLPLTNPSNPGQLWNNGGVVSIS